MVRLLIGVIALLSVAQADVARFEVYGNGGSMTHNHKVEVMEWYKVEPSLEGRWAVSERTKLRNTMFIQLSTDRNRMTMYNYKMRKSMLDFVYTSKSADYYRSRNSKLVIGVYKHYVYIKKTGGIKVTVELVQVKKLSKADIAERLRLDKARNALYWCHTKWSDTTSIAKLGNCQGSNFTLGFKVQKDKQGKLSNARILYVKRKDAETLAEANAKEKLILEESRLEKDRYRAEIINCNLHIIGRPNHTIFIKRSSCYSQGGSVRY